jgi:GNAT superfamily N-acetyltransferase
MNISNDIQIRAITPADKTWIIDLVTKRWGSNQVVSRGVVHNVDQLPGYVALMISRPVGLLTYHISGREFEIVTLDSLVEGKGIGTALILAAQEKAMRENCRRVWLITTNDNLPALRFYQKRGFRISAVHQGALKNSRLLKPEIPQVGMYGIPIRDEIEVELVINL